MKKFVAANADDFGQRSSKRGPEGVEMRWKGQKRHRDGSHAVAKSRNVLFGRRDKEVAKPSHTQS